MEALGDALIDEAAAETNLSAARLTGERGRTTMQLRMFAGMLREGSWLEATIDTAIPDKTPPRPDIRKMMIPIGPVIVFGASNFPFAYSTAGGDTASALAAGCPVIVKAHPAHAATSELVAKAIKKAITICNMPQHVFQHLHANTFEAGKTLVQHPLTAAVGFTGSYSGGRALYDHAQERLKPIPVFAEMGSVNPVIFFPDILEKNTAALAKLYGGSVTLGMGQFCTNPGLMFAIESEALNDFLRLLGQEIAAVTPAKMLHAGIYKSYYDKMKLALQQKNVELVNQSNAITTGLDSLPSLATVNGATFLQNTLLHEEVFGPYSLVIKCKDVTELKKAWKAVAGQLTTSLMGTEKDFTDFRDCVDMATDIAGRVNFNNVPTGVEVCAGMVHGGPFPASTDARFTAVGVNAVKRWVRPMCYQNCPSYLLPDALKNENPTNAWRLVNNEWTKAAVL
jgi:NADP-dependent aldehyde dehydrogenase